MSVASTTGVRTGIQLRQVLDDAEFLYTRNRQEIRFSHCTNQVNECRAGDLFVALLEDETDGHEEAALAVKRGAIAVVTERLLPVDVPQCLVTDSREAFGRICHALAGDPCNQIATVAVGGTDGKTVTSHLIAKIFEEAAVPTALHSTLQSNWMPTNNLANSKSTNKPTNGAMTAPCLASSLARMVMEDMQVAVVEADSPSLAQRRFCGTSFDIAVLTNIRGNHFSFHNTMANYRRAQLRLLDYLKPSGSVVLNADDRATQSLLPSITAPCLTIGMKQDADVFGTVLEMDLFETTFSITAGDENIIVRTKIPGLHHVYNCLTAAAVGLLNGIDLPTIARGLESVERLPGRMNLVKCGQAFPIAIDESTSPYRLGVALHTLKQQVSGRVICVFNSPDMADDQTASQFGRIAERSSSIPVITRSTANRHQPVGTPDEYEPIHQILDGFQRPSAARIMTDRIAAIEWALSEAGPDDAILIAGRGAQPIASLSEGKWKLTDEEVCQSWLYGDSVPGQRIPVSVEPPSIFKIDDYRRC